MPSGSETVKALQERGLDSVLEPARRAGEGAEARLLSELADLDWTVLDDQQDALGARAATAPGDVSPPELVGPSSRAGNEDALACGWAALAEGRVALATVAGGQASRLGCSGPKGAFEMGPVRQTTLFEILAGQVHRLGEKAGIALPWIVQTGPENHQGTKDFFSGRGWFGLDPAQVQLVCQGTLPVLSPEGQLLLAAPDRLFRSPNGHGGFYGALKTADLFAKLQGGGTEIIFYCQVDNPLVRMGDPVFIGHHLLQEARMSVKVVEKVEPEEKVGLVALRDGRTCCLEYSDLSKSFQRQKDPDGALTYKAGNIAVHAFTIDFAQEMAEARLPLHSARKRVTAMDEDGVLQELDAVKFETFVFDALPLAEKVVVQMCDREEEFAPVKNAKGADSPRTCAAALDARARRWLTCARPDISLPEGQPIELDPRLALDSEDLESRASLLTLQGDGMVELAES